MNNNTSYTQHTHTQTRRCIAHPEKASDRRTDTQTPTVDSQVYANKCAPNDNRSAWYTHTHTCAHRCRLHSDVCLCKQTFALVHKCFVEAISHSLPLCLDAFLLVWVKVEQTFAFHKWRCENCSQFSPIVCLKHGPRFHRTAVRVCYLWKSASFLYATVAQRTHTRTLSFATVSRARTVQLNLRLDAKR